MSVVHSLAHLLEPEEFIGAHWHRLVGSGASWPRFPDAAVTFESMQPGLGVFFRGIGGAAGLKLAAAVAETLRHRLSVRLRLGLGEERVVRPRRDDSTVYLPPVVDAFPDAALNRDLYLWLAAFFVFAEPPAPGGTALQQDVAFLAVADAATRAALSAFPGLRPLHARLCEALRPLRPWRRLPADEQAVESAVLRLLGACDDDAVSQAPVVAPSSWPGSSGSSVAVGAGGGGPDESGHDDGKKIRRRLSPYPGSHEDTPGHDADGAWTPGLPASDWAALARTVPSRHYRPFLPVPLWGEIVSAAPQPAPPPDAETGGGGSDAGDGRVRKASRRAADQTERNDGLILNRMEKLLSLIEHMNINRAVEDDYDEGARKALDDAEDVVLSAHRRRPSTRLKFDLDLAPPTVEGTGLIGTHTYPEWDYKARQYHRDHCRVLAAPAAEEGEAWQPDADTWRRIHRVRRQFEALRPRPEMLRAQLDGTELDLEAVVRARTDIIGSGASSDRVHLATRRQARDLSVALLIDTSLSTDAWIDNRRVLDIAKESLLVLAHGLTACGDEHAILTFTSRRRDRVQVDTVKDFDEAFGPAVQRRIAALRPGYYTRMGAAIRHAAAALTQRPHSHRLLMVVTDGKPNDIDHYEGRYGVEDTAMAVKEERRSGLAVFGVTIDSKAQVYFPALFGRGGYAIVSNPARLPVALPALYRHLVAR
jgi:nitric oxide reductase NorD protein